MKINKLSAPSASVGLNVYPNQEGIVLERTRIFRRAAGFTMLETMIALFVAAVALMGLLSAISSIMRLTDSNHQQITAVNIARQKLSDLQNASFQTVFAAYGPSSDRNKSTVKDLEGGTCKYIFPANSAGKLDETVVDAELGMPQDLNGDGDAADTDVSTSYKVLPVRVQITWDTPNGTREVKLNTMLITYK